MNYLDDDGLFGHDMRHKPPMADMLTAKGGWGFSHGRLAYSNMVRSQEGNISEYAVTTVGGPLKGYVIVNAREVPYNKDTALKVAHNRVAIPVKEFARFRHLSPHDQWELMNPRWVGTFDDNGSMINPFRSKRPTLGQAMSDAMDDDRYDEFMRQFWSPEYEHKAALDRLERRMQNLQREAEALRKSVEDWNRQITQVVNDMTNQRLEWYHLQGYNVNEYLRELRRSRDIQKEKMLETQMKADNIREYLSQMTF